MKEITIKAYKISELPEEIQEKIWKQYGELATEVGWEYGYYDIRKDAERVGYVIENYAYDWHHIEGYIKKADLLKVTKTLNEFGIREEELAKELEKEFWETYEKIKAKYTTERMEREGIETDELDEFVYDLTCKELDDYFTEEVGKLVKRWLDSTMEDVNSKEYAIEFFEANKYLFTADGVMIPNEIIGA